MMGSNYDLKRLKSTGYNKYVHLANLLAETSIILGKQEENLPAAFPAILRSCSECGEGGSDLADEPSRGYAEPEPVTQGLMDRFPACFCINK